MSSILHSRAAAFTSQPQAVEVYQAGAWWSGELLGWRHDDAGACEVRVRVLAGGGAETLWLDLASVRLPEPSAPQPTVSIALGASATPTVATAAVVPAAPGGGPGPNAEATAHLTAVGHHTGATVRRPGGRRRATEDAGAESGPAFPAYERGPGRHRAPAEAADGAAGRHRAADTGVVPAVAGVRYEPVSAASDATPPTVARAASAARGPLPTRAPSAGRGWTPPADSDADLLTRPMRLSDQIPHTRRPRVDAR